MTKAFLLLLVSSAAALAQPVRFGVKGGVPFGQPTADFGHLGVDADHWTVGPTVEFRLPSRLSLEIDGLYSSYTVRYPTASDVAGIGETKVWDFPAAFKYRLRNGSSPFVFGGVNYRRESTDIRTACLASAPQPCTTFSYAASQDRLGPVFGAGVEWNARRVRISPEFRYVHLNRPGANQYLLLFGVTF